jgi:hypothetical protein
VVKTNKLRGGIDPHRGLAWSGQAPPHRGQVRRHVEDHRQEDRWCAAATRYEKTARAFLGVPWMAATMDWLKVAKS